MRRRSVVPLAIGTVLGLGACAFDTVTVVQQSRLVEVHAILNTNVTIQGVIVERVLTGSGGGASAAGGVVPIFGANVTVTGPTGHIYIATAVDTVAGDPGQPGVHDSTTEHYEFHTAPPFALLPGSTYTLRVVTPEGEVVTGSTRIPFERPVNTSTTLFNRDRDTLSLSWPGESGGASYWLRVEGLTSTFEQFLDSTHVRVGHDLQSLDFNGNTARNQVFVPGFLTPITVAAVDQNCYDYFRSISDPFTGLGRINHLVGGYGVFGSLAMASIVNADVTADVTDPVIEGLWKATLNSGGAARAVELRLYDDREHPSTDSTSVALAGSYRPDSGPRAHLFGSRNGTEIIVGLFSGSSTSPDDVFTGTVKGNSLRGVYERDGQFVTFTRVPP